ncbi:MAG: RNA polymerase sigma factor [Planctomycetaceae bacterium]
MPQEFPDTRASLLVDIRDPSNVHAWSVFSELYRPVIYRMARRRGLQDADAQDLAQKVLVSVARAIGDWEEDANRGRFRHWLSRVTRNAIIDVFRRMKPDAALGGSAVTRVLNQSPAAQETEIDYEYERAMFRQAARLVQKEFQDATWKAFWQTTVDGKPVALVASQLGQTPGAIYTARSRVMKRLKEAVDDLRDARS